MWLQLDCDILCAFTAPELKKELTAEGCEKQSLNIKEFEVCWIRNTYKICLQLFGFIFVPDFCPVFFWILLSQCLSSVKDQTLRNLIIT